MEQGLQEAVCVCVCVCVYALGCVQLFVIPWTVACEACPICVHPDLHSLRI